MRTAEQIFEDYASLPEAERDELRLRILSDLEGPTESREEVAEAWRREIERRIADEEAGRAEVLSHEEFWRGILPRRHA